MLVATADLLSCWNGAEYLPNPIDPIFLEESTQKEDYTIFLPARIEEQTKNIHLAFEAWDKVKCVDKNVQLKVIHWGEAAEGC